ALITLVVLGGIDRAWGAFFGGLVFVLTDQVFQGAQFFFAFVGLYSAVLLIVFLMFRLGGLLQIGKLQIELIRERPMFGSAAGLGRTFQQVRLFRNLTVMENLLVAQHRHLHANALAAMLRLPSWRRDERIARERVEAILDVVNLRPWANAYPTHLSYGTLRFLELASVLS